ncbi:MAG TPA: ATP-binding cassette domain-containing protein [Ktedonobacterales bacterium]|nr:ATP-binding cassette domain-containing protein [Ktedonobacterales bacterium]
MSIVVERMSHNYNVGTPQERMALRDISLTIPDGACAAIVGVTGSGKSTLTQHFNGLLLPTSGRVIIDGLDVTGRKTKPEHILALRRRVGLLFQFPEAQLFAPTIAEDVAFGPQQLRLKAALVKERVRWALNAVALPSDDAFLARSPFALSGGQRRRVALAGVLAMRPLTLVLDEPSAGLDGEAREEIYACLASLRTQEGVTLVIVSHDMSEVAHLADLVFALANGELRLAGPPDEVFQRTEEIAACGLLPPPLAQTLTLAREHGVPLGPTALTADALASAITAAAPVMPAVIDGHASLNSANGHTGASLNGHSGDNGRALNGHAAPTDLPGEHISVNGQDGHADADGNGRGSAGSAGRNQQAWSVSGWQTLYDVSHAQDERDTQSGLNETGEAHDG